MTITPKPPEQLAREDLIRQTLEAAARKVENYSVNRTYAKAFRLAARLIRELELEVAPALPKS